MLLLLLAFVRCWRCVALSSFVRRRCRRRSSSSALSSFVVVGCRSSSALVVASSLKRVVGLTSTAALVPYRKRCCVGSDMNASSGVVRVAPPARAHTWSPAATGTPVQRTTHVEVECLAAAGFTLDRVLPCSVACVGTAATTTASLTFTWFTRHTALHGTSLWRCDSSGGAVAKGCDAQATRHLRDGFPSRLLVPLSLPPSHYMGEPYVVKTY